MTEAQKKIEYDCFEYCNKCGKLNQVNATDYIQGGICEAETRCSVCGHKDYWAYGFFKSREDGLNKSRKY